MKLPKSWNALTVGQLMEVEQLRQRSDLEPIDQSIQLLSIVSNTPVEVVEAMPYNDLMRQYNALAWMDTPPPKSKPLKRIKISGKTYRFQPNPAAIQGHLFATLQTLTAQQAMNDNLHKVMAALLIPQRRRWYGWEDVHYDKVTAADEWQKLSEAVKREMPADVAYNYSLFFSALLPKLLAASATFFQRMNRAMKKKAKSLNPTGY